jgi:RNA polymerase-binding protein DksA
MEDFDQSLVKAKLLERQQDLEARIEELEMNAEREQASREPTYADQAQDLLRHERRMASIDQAKAQLEQVTAALGRLAEGSYGVCQRCGKPIASGRLEALPQATLCVECQARAAQP